MSTKGTTVTAGRAKRWRDNQLVYLFSRSRMAQAAMATILLLFLTALGADILAPFDAFNPANANIIDARLPPGSVGLNGTFYMLGTDPDGRDMLSAMIYGLRTSMIIGLSCVALSAVFGVMVGLIAGYFGGWIDSVMMRMADVQLSFPAILIALLIDGIARTVMSQSRHDAFAVPILIASISASFWVQYARTVRGLVLIERSRDYILAARITGVRTSKILLSHILPNVLGPVFVIASVNLALAILTEATLSFLGVGIPANQPSLGSLVRIGNEFLFSGDWWISVYPGALLVILSLAVNLFGDWLRDAMNPKLAT